MRASRSTSAASWRRSASTNRSSWHTCHTSCGTLLNSIIAFRELLLEHIYDELNERRTRYQEHVLTAGQHLLSRINDILDLSKVETGRMELERDRFTLTYVLESGVALVRERAHRHGIALQLDVDPAIGRVGGMRARCSKWSSISCRMPSARAGARVSWTPGSGTC